MKIRLFHGDFVLDNTGLYCCFMGGKDKFPEHLKKYFDYENLGFKRSLFLHNGDKVYLLKYGRIIRTEFKTGQCDECVLHDDSCGIWCQAYGESLYNMNFKEI